MKLVLSTVLAAMALPALADVGQAALKVTPALPEVSYAAMYKGELRSPLLSSIVMLAQEACDFTRTFQTARPS